MTGPRCLPEHLRERERREKRAEQHQLLLASCGYTRVYMAWPVATDVNPHHWPQLQHQHRHMYRTTQKITLSLCWAALPPYGYILSIPFPLLQKKKNVCYVLLSSQMRCTKGRSRPHFRAWDRIRSDRGTGPLFPTSGSFFGPRGVTLETTNQKRGEAARCVTARAHLAQQRMTNDSNKQINYASNEMNMNIMAYNE